MVFASCFPLSACFAFGGGHGAAGIRGLLVPDVGNTGTRVGKQKELSRRQKQATNTLSDFRPAVIQGRQTVIRLFCVRACVCV